jgi:hypothetical protein
MYFLSSGKAANCLSKCRPIIYVQTVYETLTPPVTNLINTYIDTNNVLAEEQKTFKKERENEKGKE